MYPVVKTKDVTILFLETECFADSPDSVVKCEAEIDSKAHCHRP